MMVDGHLAEKDLKVDPSIGWTSSFASMRSEILAALPTDRFAEFRAGYDHDPEKHRRALPFLIFRHPSPEMPRPTPEDEARLLQTVSPARPANCSTPWRDEQERSSGSSNLDSSGILQPHASTGRTAKNWMSSPPTRLDPRQRERLENLPRDRMYNELRRLYYQDRFRRMSGDPGKRPFPGPPPGRRRPIPTPVEGHGSARSRDARSVTTIARTATRQSTTGAGRPRLTGTISSPPGPKRCRSRLRPHLVAATSQDRQSGGQIIGPRCTKFEQHR